MQPRVDRSERTGASRPLVLLVPWGSEIEDFLEPNGLTLDAFCGSFTGSWMFGYVGALAEAGVDVELVVTSATVRRTRLRTHAPTGAVVAVLPAPTLSRALRRAMRDPLESDVRRTFRGPARLHALLHPLLVVAWSASPYLAVPLRALRREVRRSGAAAILCQEYESAVFDGCVLVGRLAGVPVFASFQGANRRRAPSERLVRERSVPAAAGLIVASGREVERIRRVYESLPPVARIPNPVDLEVWRPGDATAARREESIPPGAFVLAWHGRVELRKKGLDVLLDAWARLRAGSGEAVLLLLGDGPDGDEVARLARRARPGTVRFVRRFFHDPAELSARLAAADAWVLSSRSEGFPVALVEAMACGLAIVAAEVDGVSDALGAGDEAVGLVVPADDADALARAIRRLLEDRELARTLGARARERAEQTFARAAVGARLRDVLLGGKD